MLYQNSFNELEDYVTPSDIIEFLYCPRFTYYMRCLDIRQYEEKRFKVQVGREKHIEKSNSSVSYVRKRIDGVSKEQEKYLISKVYKLKGRVDEFGLMSIFWTQKVKLFYAALLANNSH